MSKVTPAKAKAALKTGTAYVAEVDGSPWLGTSYFAARADRPGPAQDLLHAYNLVDHRGRLEVNGTVQAGCGEPPRVDQVIPKDAEMVELVPMTVEGHAVFTFSGRDGRQLSLYDTVDGRTVALDSAYLAMLGECELRQAGEGKAVLAVVVSNGVAEKVGVIMPVRIA